MVLPFVRGDVSNLRPVDGPKVIGLVNSLAVCAPAARYGEQES